MGNIYFARKVKTKSGFLNGVIIDVVDEGKAYSTPQYLIAWENTARSWHRLSDIELMQQYYIGTSERDVWADSFQA